MADTLIDALEQEHHQIDAGLEAFVHGLGSGELRRDEFTRAADALRRHIYLEEAFLFPPIRDAGLVPPILVMLREHGTIWQALDALDEDVDALEKDIAGVGSGDPAAGRAAVATRCRDLLGQLESHNSKEEPVIYPQGGAVLSEQAKDQLHDFIERGAMPDGWVCERA